jgi:para-nitrobenzyl esterase
MKFIRSARSAAIFCLIAIPAWSQTARVESGAIEGTKNRGLYEYLGVPFAAPPVDALRWREPQAVAPWQGSRAAKSFAPACVQEGVSMPGETPPATSEDCLYLNVWTPARSAGANLPVLVWIHGGGYKNGATSMPQYRGGRLARRGIIVVTLAYRLGPLGFLAHPELTAESPHGTSGNYGLLDQVAALEWVQRNIASFGGDPRRVTIAGQSSGATSVSVLMASPRAKGLFHGAIGQSGGLFEPLRIAPSYLLENAERDGKAYATSLGAGSLAALRALPVAQLLGGKAHLVGHPVIEPWLLPVPPHDAFKSGAYNDVPLLVGFNAEEARALTDVGKVTASTFVAGITKSFGALPPQLMGAYPHATDEQAKQARLDFERDLRFGWDIWKWARLQARPGRARAYLYLFAKRPPFPAGSVRENWGASHFAELWYMFDNLDVDSWRWSAEDRALANVLAGYWTHFVKTGDPNGRGLPGWPAYDGADAVAHFGEEVTIAGLPNEPALKIFDAVYDGLRGD